TCVGSSLSCPPESEEPTQVMLVIVARDASSCMVVDDTGGPPETVALQEANHPDDAPPPYPSTASVQRFVNQDTTFTITCNVGSGPATAAATVAIRNPALIRRFFASPALVEQGQPTLLQWWLTYNGA